MPPEKTRLHPRNKNRERYDLSALIESTPELANYLKPNKLGEDSVDFANPAAVKFLNKAILLHYYGIKDWNFPDENLCPPIPGRADYIHHIADLLSKNNSNVIPKGETVTCFDIGVGASCIYPIIGTTEYGWNFIGSDTDSKSIECSQKIIDSNASLKGKIDCRLQTDSNNFFKGIIGKNDEIDISICNPPFHSSLEEAQKGSQRKIKNLTGKNTKSPTLNFAGVSNELIYPDGELGFIDKMIQESEMYAKNVLWFSTLVAKQSHLKEIYYYLEDSGVKEIETIAMGTGNKSSRIVAWSFLSKTEQAEWKQTRWS